MFHFQNKSFSHYLSIRYIGISNKFSPEKAENRGVKMYYHFVLNPNITIENASLTGSTQYNWFMCPLSQHLIWMWKQKFFAFMTSDTSSTWNPFLYERVKSEASKFIAILSGIRMFSSKTQLWLTTLNKFDWCAPSLCIWFLMQKQVFRICDQWHKFYLNHFPVWNSGVRIWKFCNPDRIRNFFIDSIPNPYPKI